jgi:serine phosphatase RsbU (regulator of sigma subunit)
MSAARIPWWIWLVAASFIACFLVGFVYLPFKLPQATGINFDFRNKQVASVVPGSPGDAAGVKLADRIVSVDGRAVQNAIELAGALSNTTFDHAVSIVVLRGGQEVHLQLTLNEMLIHAWTSKEYLGWWVEVAVSLIQLLVGLLVLFKRPRDLTAVAAGIFLCGLGTGNFLFVSPNAAVVWRNLPVAIQWLIFPVVILSPGGFPIAPALLFSLSFPKPLLHHRWAWMVLAVLTAPLLGFATTFNYIVLFAPKRAVGAFPGWLGAIIVINFLVAFLASLVICAVNYLRLREVNERRRIRLVVFGLLLFFVNLLASILFSLSQKTFWLSTIFISPLVFGLSQVPFTICVAYAVLKQRLFQISFIVRQSLQYAAARGALLIPIPILAGILIFDLIAHKDQPFGVLFSARGWAYGLLGVAGVIAHKKQLQWMEALDRAFFRSAYDSRVILHDLAEKTRTVGDRRQLAMLLERHVSEALHPKTFASYFESGDGQLAAISGALSTAPKTLAASAPVFAELAHYGKPLEVPAGFARAEALALLAPLAPECLVPILGHDNNLIAMLVLGQRLSEEPYSGEDKQLLDLVAAHAGIALENIGLAEKMAGRMEVDRRIAQEMEFARQVQARLFPQKLPAMKTLEYTGGCIQARMVGGDYYDFLELRLGRLALVLADIAGKGVSGALLMASLQANLRSQYAMAIDDLPGLLASVNRSFYESTDDASYATLFFADYDDSSRKLRYANCGHLPPLLLRASASSQDQFSSAPKVEWLYSTCTVVGLSDPWHCEIAEVELSPGDTLVLYTDGITEATNADGEEFGQSHLLDTVDSHSHLPVGLLLQTVVAAVQRFTGGSEQQDDITLVVARSLA